MIKFLDIKKINDRYDYSIREAVNRVLDSGWYILGKEVENFEKEFSEYHNCSYTIATSNGLDALKLILRSYIELGVFKEGDEIIVPANTFIASVLAISDAKLQPVLVEVSEKDFLIDANEIKNKITDKTKGIMNVHLYGQISYSLELQDIISKNNLIHIEDNAQAIGAEYKNTKSGLLGDAGAISFYPGKNLGALGDAGAITTNNKALADMCKTLSNYGSKEKYIHNYRGFNTRMDEMQAAVLRVKLKHIDTDNTERQKIAKRYISEINNPKITLPNNPKENKKHVWHLFVVRSKDRDNLQKYLSNNNVQSLIHYPVPISQQESYKEFANEEYFITDQLSKEILSIPISPVLTEPEVDKVIELLNNF